MSSLQLAFAAMSTLQPPLWATTRGLRQPFTLISDAVEQAQSLVQEFEMGRRKRLLGCMGRLYTCSISSLEARAGGREWKAGDIHTLCVELSNDSSYQLSLQRAPQTLGFDDGLEEGCDGLGAKKEATQISMRAGTRSLRVSRRWLGDVPGLQPHNRSEALASDQPVYLFEPTAAEGTAAYALLFEVPPFCLSDDEDSCSQRSISAEAFEAILTMLLLKDGIEDGKHCLAHVSDLDSKAGVERFLASLSDLVGPYAPMAAADHPCDDGSVALLSSQMRQASLG